MEDNAELNEVKANRCLDMFAAQREDVDDCSWLHYHMVQTGGSQRQSWQDSEQDEERCPITLEPLHGLERPPFGLKSVSDGASSRGIWHHDERELAQSSGELFHWFDGVALASFFVSGYGAGLWDPVNRRPLERSECESLDEYWSGDTKNKNSKKQTARCTKS